MATHTDSDERVKKLFVGGLKRDTPDETLREYFEAFGELSDCVVIRDSQTKVSRGFGYVTFSSKDSVIEVLKVKKEKGVINIDGKDVEVKRAIPRDDNSSTAHVKTRKIFIGGIPDEATAEDIKQCISNEIRGEPVTVDLIMKKNEDGTKSTMHRGFCFVECEDEDIADELCCIKKVNIAGKDVEVKKAEPKDKGAQGGRGGRGGGGRGGYSGRGRGGGGGGGGGDYGYGYQSGGGGGYQSYGGYSDPSYGYGGSYDPYGNGSYGYGAMGMGYQQASSNYGPQSYQGRGGGRGRYQPY